MAFEPFATAEDYRAQYPDDDVADARLSRLLTAASLRLDTELGRYRPGYARGEDETYDLKLSTVCCEMAHDVVVVPSDVAGATQWSRGAGNYTSSVTFAAARGSFSLTRPQRQLLGFVGGGIGSIGYMTAEDR